MLDTVLLVAVLAVFATGVVVDGLLQLVAASLRPARTAMARSTAPAPARRPLPGPALLARR